MYSSRVSSQELYFCVKMTDVTCHEESNPSTPSTPLFQSCTNQALPSDIPSIVYQMPFYPFCFSALSAHCDNSPLSDILSQKVCKPRCLSVPPFRHSRQANNRPPSCLGSADISYLRCTQTAPQYPRSPICLSQTAYSPKNRHCSLFPEKAAGTADDEI